VAHAVAHGLRQRGIDVLTVGDSALRTTQDIEILARASAEGRVIVPHDADFLRLHRRDTTHAGIAYCRQGTRSIGDMIERLVMIYELLDPEDIAGQVEYF
jgi:predicted nuclease of predicted toxin-antitoxin system